MQRAVLVLRSYGAATESEIADTLGCSAGFVKTHASRGIASLRRALGDEGKQLHAGDVPGAGHPSEKEPRTAS